MICGFCCCLFWGLGDCWGWSWFFWCCWFLFGIGDGCLGCGVVGGEVIWGCCLCLFWLVLLIIVCCVVVFFWCVFVLWWRVFVVVRLICMWWRRFYCCSIGVDGGGLFWLLWSWVVDGCGNSVNGRCIWGVGGCGCWVWVRYVDCCLLEVFRFLWIVVCLCRWVCCCVLLLCVFVCWEGWLWRFCVGCVWFFFVVLF